MRVKVKKTLRGGQKGKFRRGMELNYPASTLRHMADHEDMDFEDLFEVLENGATLLNQPYGILSH